MTAIQRVILGMHDPREDYDVPRSNRPSMPLPPPPGGAAYNKRPSQGSIASIGSAGSMGSMGSLKVPGGGSSSHLFYDTPPSSNRVSRDNPAANANTSNSNNEEEGIYDTPPSSKRTSCERTTPPHSNRSSASRDSTGSPAAASASAAAAYQQNQHQHSHHPPHHLGMASALNQSQQSLNQSLNRPPPNNLPTFTLDDVRRRRSGSRSSDNCYETPPGSNRSSNRSSLERILSEEGPPIYESLSPASSLERIPTAEGASSSAHAPHRHPGYTPQRGHDDNDDDEDATYDTLPVRNHVLSNANPSSQTSLHSTASSESLLSAASGMSGVSGASGSHRLSQANSTASGDGGGGSLPDSARSSMDIPSDTYDVPPQSQNLDRSRKQLSMDSGLGLYDSPTKSRPTSSSSNTAPAFPSSSSSSSSTSSSQQHLDNFIPSKSSSSSSKEFKRSKSLENSLDDDLYDTPKNNTLKANNNGSRSSAPRAASFGSSCTVNQHDTSGSSVYDVPPQVTRDSVISNRSDSSSDESLRLSSSSFELDPNKMGMGLWDELLLDYDSALEVLVKRQQDVSKATSRLSGFVTMTWRTRASLEKTLYDIKVSCSMVQNCLIEFVDFAQGTIANASKIADMQLANRLYKYVAPLQNTLELVNKSFSNLEEMKWQVAMLCEPMDKSKTDDLGQIALVSKDLMVDVKRVASFIQSNSQSLFRKASVLDGKKSVASKPPIVPKMSDGNGSSSANSKLGNGYGYAKLKSVQQRPLPAVPSSTPPHPPPPPPPSSSSSSSSNRVSKVSVDSPSSSSVGAEEYTSKKSMYAIKEALHKDDYEECDELFFERRSGSHRHVYTNDGDNNGDETTGQSGQEYDYVQLDDNNTLTRSNSRAVKEENNKQQKHGKDGDVEKEDDDVKTLKENDNNQKDQTVMADDDQTYSKINNDEEQLETKTSKLALEDKQPDQKSSEGSCDSKSHELVDNDVDMIPVKESSTLERPKDKNIPSTTSAEDSIPASNHCNSSNSSVANQNSDHQYSTYSSSADVVVSTNSNESDDQDEKTPVNLKSLDGDSHFPLPDPENPTTTTTNTSVPDASALYDTTTPISMANLEPLGEQLDPNDHQVLVHYAEQMNSHSTLLANSIDAFIGAVGSNQPPNVFISHSKFVIVSAHKLVHIGDTVHRNLASNAISARVMHSANHLCDCLKASVNATKMAALQYPSPVAIQEMVDKVIAVSHAAHQLKFIMTQAHRQ